MKKNPPCFMCKNKPAKALTAKKGDSYYVNARDVVMFCSMRCAANYGLLWGCPEILQTQHYCPVDKKWVCCAAYECNECHGKE